MGNVKSKFQWVLDNRFMLFLISFVLMIVGDVFFDEAYADQADLILMLQNFLFSYVLFIGRAKWLRVLISIIILSAILSVGVSIFTGVTFSTFFACVYVAYFILIGARIVGTFTAHELSGTEMVMAAFSGFILLAVLGALLFMVMGGGGFSGQLGNGTFSDYLYFSFVTLLTIGYGEIVPSSEEARKLVILLGLAGNFYTVFVVAIIVGKFISESKSK